MSHAERIELIGALMRSGASYYKSHDFEIKFGGGDSSAGRAHVELAKQDNGHNPAAAATSAPPSTENPDATKKLTDLIETLKRDDASLVDKIFPAGAGL